MKKGFTLIELLAVIVILAIIALIATPIVLNIINDTKKSAVIRSADFYIDALENEIMLENMKQGGNFNPSTCTISNKVITCDSKEINLKVDGEVPTSGTITFEEGKVKDVTLTYQNGTVTLNNKGELVLGESQEELASGLYDENNNLLASWDELNNIALERAENQYGLKEIIQDGAPHTLVWMDGLINHFQTATKLVIDESITSIGESAFSGCTSLKEIIIPNSVTRIGKAAFFRCTNLTGIIIPNSITSIGESAFSGCTNLKEITIPNSVTSIGDWAFSDCTNLKEITIPNSVTFIQDSVFYGCTNLTTIYYKGTATGSPWGAPNAKVETNF